MQQQPSSNADAVRKRAGKRLSLRPPTADDGADVWDLVAACPPLDRNSMYCNLLQCTDFAETCILAERSGRALGWVSGYCPPNDESTLFIWQVAVHEDARGLGLAKAMILSLLDRPACRGVEYMKTTITPENQASWALFESVAGALQAEIERRAHFDAKTHFRGRHDTEHLVTIGPFQRADNDIADQHATA